MLRMKTGCMGRWSLGLKENLDPGPYQHDWHTEVRKQSIQGPRLYYNMVFRNFRKTAFNFKNKKRLNSNSESSEKLKISKISLNLLSVSNFRQSILKITDIIRGKFSDHWRLHTQWGDSHKKNRCTYLFNISYTYLKHRNS